MTRNEVSATLRYMERLREDSYEADSVREERRMDAQYGRLWRSIQPYVEGKLPYSDDPPITSTRD